MLGSAVGTRNLVLDLMMDFHSLFLTHNSLFNNSSIHLVTHYVFLRSLDLPTWFSAEFFFYCLLKM